MKYNHIDCILLGLEMTNDTVRGRWIIIIVYLSSSTQNTHQLQWGPPESRKAATISADVLANQRLSY